MDDLLYDDKDMNSIIQYAQKLENKTIGAVNAEQHSFAGRKKNNPILQTPQNKRNKGGGCTGKILLYKFGKENIVLGYYGEAVCEMGWWKNPIVIGNKKKISSKY